MSGRVLTNIPHTLGGNAYEHMVDMNHIAKRHNEMYPFTQIQRRQAKKKPRPFLN